MILGLESYCYFTGDIRKQPRLMVPAVGQPRVIAFESEADEVRKSTWTEEIITYRALHEMMIGIINFRLFSNFSGN
jgi:Xaa-Pro aminopeptidase